MHHSNGRPCSCRETPSTVGNANYADEHPNAEPNFNDEVAAAIQKSNDNRTSL